MKILFVILLYTRIWVALFGFVELAMKMAFFKLFQLDESNRGIAYFPFSLEENCYIVQSTVFHIKIYCYYRFKRHAEYIRFTLRYSTFPFFKILRVKFLRILECYSSLLGVYNIYKNIHHRVLWARHKIDSTISTFSSFIFFF